MAHRLDDVFSGQGSIHLISGPMFSGKTTEIIRRLNCYSVAQQRALLVRHGVDTRWADEEGIILRTHSYHSLKQDGSIQNCVASTLLEVVNQLPTESKSDTPSVVAIDEGQFFPDLAEGCQELASRGMCVIVAALDGTFDQTPFLSVSTLYPHCDEVLKLQGVCMRCHARPSSFTIRTEKTTAPTEKGYVSVGGAEKYAAVCRACLRK